MVKWEEPEPLTLKLSPGTNFLTHFVTLTVQKQLFYAILNNVLVREVHHAFPKKFIIAWPLRSYVH